MVVSVVLGWLEVHRNYHRGRRGEGQGMGVVGVAPVGQLAGSIAAEEYHALRSNMLAVD